MAGKYTKKLTMRSIGLMPDDLEALALEVKKEIAVARVAGRILQATPGHTEKGEYVKFSGEFVAINLLTGDEIRAQECILPAVAELLCLKLLEHARAEDKNAVAQFGLDITVRENKTSYEKGWKFTYGVQSLSDMPTDDSLSLLLKQFGAIPMLTDKSAPAPAASKKRK